MRRSRPNSTDMEDIACDPVQDAEPSDATVQDVLALVNKELRKGTKGKELDPKQLDSNE